MTEHSDPRNELVDHLPAMRAFAMSLSRNAATADDLVQDAIVKAWSNLDKFEPGTNLRAWLFTILRNTYYSQFRKRRHEVEDPEGAHAATLSEQPRHDGRLAVRDFRSAFRELTDEQREALVLVGVEGFSYQEAAEMCGCAVGTVKSRINRARKRLAELMDLEEDGVLGITDATTAEVHSATRAI
ncbi:RNA polymerase sigma factor [Sedimentitalea sp. JM2-8]|uniref:RNA polymerase sigma factor n=1 Tax=Sedimentitalea xiamensis TaxID=3050037 RepID=A0ABT7FIM7_9RHOB|nr:RNA polymerase sigma factor [Sedimentitalea xiamensis]MDK3074976.1 RNA polymerase sigma factor [Sedimentitalea xiamensis]